MKEVLIFEVCDFNGTIAKDGCLIKGVKEMIRTLSQRYKIFILTSDTFGSVKEELKDSNVSLKILHSKDHSKEKASFITELGTENCAAIGNGNNDSSLLKNAKLSISILGDEGCSRDTLLNSDIICKDIIDALELFIHPKRLIATLRK